MNRRWIVLARAPSRRPRLSGGQRHRRLVVHLKGERERRVAGQPQPAHRAVAAQRAGGADGVVVEAPGHRHPAYGGGQFVGGLGAAGRLADRVDLRGVAEDGAQGLAQLTLGHLAGLLIGLPGGVRGLVQHDGGGGVQHPRGGEFLGDRGAAQELGVEGRPGGVDAGVQPVEAAGGPAQVDTDGEQRHRDPDQCGGHGRQGYAAGNGRGDAPGREPSGGPPPRRRQGRVSRGRSPGGRGGPRVRRWRPRRRRR